jgi:hypothetical protein
MNEVVTTIQRKNAPMEKVFFDRQLADSGMPYIYEFWTGSTAPGFITIAEVRDRISNGANHRDSLPSGLLITSESLPLARSFGSGNLNVYAFRRF